MKPASVICLALVQLSATAMAREKIPASYEAGHFFATPSAPGGRALRLVVDTGGVGGGGRYLISGQAAARLGLAVRSCGSGAEASPVVSAQWQGLPTVDRPLCGATALVADHYRSIAGEDGILGAGYLPHFVWTFDYPAGELWREDADWTPAPGMRRLPLGFPRNDVGGKASGFPRVTLAIDGQALDFLLDTGATAKPTAAGLKASGLDLVDGIGVTSYITTSLLERWHAAHPDWRVVDDGDTLLAPNKVRIIEVPRVEVAGWSIGPVWFTERPDRNFGEAGMSQWMDRPVVGAAGANIWRHFVVTLDYPRDAAWLACARCR